MFFLNPIFRAFIKICCVSKLFSPYCAADPLNSIYFNAKFFFIVVLTVVVINVLCAIVRMGSKPEVNK